MQALEKITAGNDLGSVSDRYPVDTER